MLRWVQNKDRAQERFPAKLQLLDLQFHIAAQHRHSIEPLQPSTSLVCLNVEWIFHNLEEKLLKRRNLSERPKECCMPELQAKWQKWCLKGLYWEGKLVLFSIAPQSFQRILFPFISFCLHNTVVAPVRDPRCFTVSRCLVLLLGMIENVVFFTLFLFGGSLWRSWAWVSFECFVVAK